MDRYLCMDCERLVFLNRAWRCELCSGDHLVAHDYLTNVRDLNTLPVTFKTGDEKSWIAKWEPPPKEETDSPEKCKSSNSSESFKEDSAS